MISATDTGALLQEANSVQSVGVQRRSPVTLDPYIRGYRSGQIYTQADGTNWLPVRRDLDSILSKIDPTFIKDVVVLPGPYGLRYGPGLAYIAVVTNDTPRYCNGYESHFRTGFTTRTNGGQIYARSTVYGGSADWGYYASLGQRTGSDYSPGGRSSVSKIPSSYENQNALAQFGFDLSPISRIELRYNRSIDNNVEYPAQFFDIGGVTSDSVNLSFIQDDDCNCEKLTVSTWYTFTRFTGDTFNLSKAPVIGRVEEAINDLPTPGAPTVTGAQVDGFTFGDLTSTGIRAAKTYGDEDSNQFSVGADFRTIRQKLTEDFGLSTTADPQGLVPDRIDTNMPRAQMIDPGVFAELSLRWRPFFTTSVGGRVDYAYTRARATDLRRVNGVINSSIDGAPGNFNQSDMLYAFYINNELEVTQCVTLKAGGGHAQRVPSLIDRYADGLFLANMQNGFNRVIGTPTLRKERAWQIDAGVQLDYGWWRGNLRGFHSWIDDYNLYQGLIVGDPTGARLLRSTNAELVTLTGFESSGELVVSSTTTLFGTLRYLDGRDRDVALTQGNTTVLVDQPLYGILPLEGRAGVRWTDNCGGEVWGLELGSRIVAAQDRIASLRRGFTTATELVPLETSTPGFSTLYVRGYYNMTDSLNFVGGIENLVDSSYQEHLDLRLPPQTGLTQVAADDPRLLNTQVLAPGISPYFGVEWTR